MQRDLVKGNSYSKYTEWHLKVKIPNSEWTLGAAAFLYWVRPLGKGSKALHSIIYAW
jgi:hypothetical protein